MATTQEILDEAVAAGTRCLTDNLSVQVDADAYDALRNATPEELLEAVAWFYRQAARPAVEIEEAIAFLRTGFQLAQPGGWEHVAPMWLRESRKLAAGGDD